LTADTPTGGLTANLMGICCQISHLVWSSKYFKKTVYVKKWM